MNTRFAFTSKRVDNIGISTGYKKQRKTETTTGRQVKEDLHQTGSDKPGKSETNKC